jgi:methionyl-tRNA formyltransferase
MEECYHWGSSSGTPGEAGVTLCYHARVPPLERIVFFGTPEFALPTLAALCAAGRAPALVVSQPARPVGRGRELREPPVATWARERGLAVEQPERVRDAAFLARLQALQPDLAVVVAFGQIFPRALLELPRLGCVNLHASLLPRHRGAAPVQAAIAAGDRATGVTTMLMEEGLDSGPILLQEEAPIGERETSGELGARLAELGAALVLRTLEGLERGDLVPRPQPGGATYAPRLAREAARADWALSAADLDRRLRAYTPWPGLRAELRGEPVRIVAGEPLDPGAVGGDGAPGTLLGLRDRRLAVACGQGSIFGIAGLQRPGRRPVAAADFFNGERLRAGERFA